MTKNKKQEKNEQVATSWKKYSSRCWLEVSFSSCRRRTLRGGSMEQIFSKWPYVSVFFSVELYFLAGADWRAICGVDDTWACAEYAPLHKNFLPPADYFTNLFPFFSTFTITQSFTLLTYCYLNTASSCVFFVRKKKKMFSQVKVQKRILKPQCDRKQTKITKDMLTWFEYFDTVLKLKVL